MASPIPISRPKLIRTALLKRLQPHISTINTSTDKVDPSKELVIVGIRGYYKKSMGDPTKNDRGIYDDALFIISPTAYACFNGNTDPAVYRAGVGTGNEKGIASLSPGVWRVYKFDDHRPTTKGMKPYPAICQRAGKVKVWRDSEDGAYEEESGQLGINIHRGGIDRVSSLGCQTVPPKQWDEFLAFAQAQAQLLHGAQWKQKVYPYVLIEE